MKNRTFAGLALVTAIMMVSSSFLVLPKNSANASVVDWQKGVSIDPISPTDFSSDNFKQSLKEAASMGANSVSLIIPYYQSTLTSSDMAPGWNTPTDQSLIDAITEAHALGLKVDLKPHLQSAADPGAWRATINASDRDSWYLAYENMLSHYAAIAQSHHVENITIGTELINMSSGYVYPDNTARWDKIIADLRTQFSGTLTYSANWGSSGWYDEKDGIQFWDKLDYIGISAYLPLSTDPNYTIQDLENSWWNWDVNSLKPLHDKYNKPVIFTEVGYRSADGAVARPARWQTTNSTVDLQEQVDGYQSLFNYWSKVPYFAGMNIWVWSSDPNAGGPNDNSFTPQNKPAEQLIKQWFTNNTAPTPKISPNDIVIHASNAQTGNIHGDWTTTMLSDAADGQALLNPDLGVAKASPSASPKDYIDLTFNAPANTPYHLWLRLKATNDYYGNDSVSVQFSDSLDGDLIGTTNAWPVILENGHGAGDQGWGWNDNAYVGLGPNIIFSTSGQHTIRIQTREAGVMFDQVLLSPDDYLNLSPGLFKNDTTILPVNYPGISTPTPTATPTPTPTTTPTPSPTPTPTPTSNVMDIWWPTDGSHVSGVQPFKGLLEGWDLSQYNMYWQVDSGQLNLMGDSNVDWPHKEAAVDLSGWNWNSQGVYKLNFVAKSIGGSIISEKSFEINVND